jgi:Nucleotide modification associated domain 2
MVGDNIYHTDPQTGKWLQENSVHSQPHGEQDLPNTEHDTQTDRLLISEEFFYFGENAPAAPPTLLQKIGYRNGRGHRVYEKEDCQRLLDWIKALREVVWVILDQFRKAVFCCCRCGHVGNALALSIMSTAMLYARGADL